MPDPTIDDLALRYGYDYGAAEQSLAQTYRIAQWHILEEIDRLLRADPDAIPLQLQSLLYDVTRRYQRAALGASQWAPREVRQAFLVGVAAAEQGLAQQGATRVDARFAQVNRGAVEAITRETMTDVLRATHLTAEHVKVEIRSAVLQETRLMVATGVRAKEASARIAEHLAEGGVFGIHARDGRYIPMDEYARVVANVKLRQAHTEGTVNLVTENGQDLVQITAHLHRPDACSPLEGKVYSLSGRTSGYPPLAKRTPFHPGCRHATSPFIETFRSETEVDRIRAQSNAPGQITAYSAADLERLEAEQRKRQRFMGTKRRLRRADEAAIAEGERDAPADPKAYERSLSARATQRIRKIDRERAEREREDKAS